MPWDTMVGVARRSWARNDNAVTTAMEYNRLYAGQDHITLPYTAPEDDDIIAAVLHGARYGGTMGTYITNIGLLATPRGHSARRGTQRTSRSLPRARLRDVAAGKAVLAVPSDTPTPSGMVVMVEESRPVFRDRRNRIGGW